MSFLGVHPERLGALRTALADALDYLWFIPTADPTAARATEWVRRTRDELARTWLPTLGDIQASDAIIGGFAVVEIHPVRPIDGGMGVAPSILPVTTAAPDAADAAALGAFLAANADELYQLISDEEGRRWLTEQLALIEADPALLAAFTATLGSYVALIDAIGVTHRETRLPTEAERGEPAEALEGLMELVATMYHQTSSQASGHHLDVWYPTAIDELEPYQAAMLVNALAAAGALSDTVLVDAVGRIRNVHHEQRDREGPTDSDGGWYDGTGDLLAAALIGQPSAAVLYALEATDPEHGDVTLLTALAQDGELTVQLLGIVTHPDHLDPAQAMQVVPAVVDGLRTAGFDEIDPLLDAGTSPSTAAALVLSPWILSLVGDPGSWGYDDEEIRDVLAWAVGDDDGADALTAATDELRRLIGETLITDGGVDMSLAFDLATTLAEINRILTNEAIDDDAARRIWADLLSTVATAAGQKLASRFPPPFHLLSKAVEPLVNGADDLLQGWGLLPPDAERSTQTREEAMDATTVSTAALAVWSCVLELVQTGTLDEAEVERLDEVIRSTAREGCDARNTLQALHDYAASLPDGIDVQVGYVLTMFLNPRDAAEICD